jgi:threonine/homoserine/homoserine lactone efflux protein
MIFQAAGAGLLTGLWLSMSFGPVFFILIQTSLEKGIKNALLFDAGVLLSDIFYIFIAYLGASIFFENALFEKWVAIIGGIILVFFGVIPFFGNRRPEIPREEIKTLTKADATGLVVKGFFINFLNPAVLFIWLGAASLAVGKYDNSRLAVFTFFITTLLTYFGIDILKIYLANRLKRFINPYAMKFISRLSGLIIIVFGCYLVYHYLIEVKAVV